MAAMSYAHWVTPFLQHLKTSCNMAESCRAVGATYSAMMSLKARDADFAAACDEALEESYDYLEAEARRRAFHGVEEPVVYQGQLTPLFERNADGSVRVDEDTGHPVQARDHHGNVRYLTVRKYSDGLAQFLLKGYRRKKFGDKQEITGADGGALAVVDDTKKAARLAALMALAAARKAKGQETTEDDLSDLA